MAFRESDGEFLWQHTSEKLAAGRVNDWPYQGVASSPLVEGERLYYVSNRAKLTCIDIKGFSNGNDGPFKEEKFTGPKDADIIWEFDMMEEVGSHPHNLANSSPVSYGDLIYVSTSNGQDESHVNIPSPRAPSIIALNKKTGKLVMGRQLGWRERILHGQWSSPAVGKIGDVVQLVSGQGDGWVRGYEATSGKKLWEFDLNPKDSVWPKTRNEVISTPIIVDNIVYIANGQDPEHGEGVGHLVRHRSDQARRYHEDGSDLALRQDPPFHLYRRVQGRHSLLRRLQWVPACPRRENRQAVLDARHAGRGVGVAGGHRR